MNTDTSDLEPIEQGGQPQRPLTFKQRLFVMHFLGESNGNATDAARRAGYESPTIQGFENLRKPNIQAAVVAKLDVVALTSNEVLARLADIACSDPGEFMTVDADGELGIEYAKLKDAGKTHLIKEVKKTKYGTVITLHDPMVALERLAKYHGLLRDRVDVSVPGGKSAIESFVACLLGGYGKPESVEDENS